MRINEQRLIADFAALVAIDSPTFGERDMAARLRRELEALGFTVTEDDAGARLNGTCGNLYGFLPGSLPGEPLLFCAHMDTVEPSAGKRAVFHDDGRITSAGDTVLGADDAAGIAAILEALRTLRELDAPHRPIEVLFTVAEEQYCKGAEVFDFSALRAREAYVLDLSGPVGSAANKAPTIVSFTVTIHGKASHAGFAPASGVHAVVAAAHAVSGLTLGQIDPDTTVNIGTIQGGRATNIVPDLCTVTGEIRSYSHSRALAQLELVKARFTACAEALGASVDFDTRCGCTAYETPLDSPVMARFKAACGSLGLPVSVEGTFGGSDNNHLALHGIAGLVIATAMSQCHSCEEYTTAGELARAAELTLALMTAGQ